MKKKKLYFTLEHKELNKNFIKYKNNDKVFYIFDLIYIYNVDQYVLINQD